MKRKVKDIKYTVSKKDGFYSGEVNKYGEPHGQGTMKYTNGDIYEGNFEYGKLVTDEGILKYVNGDVYKGEFSSGWPQGQGIMRYANGDVYEGEFRYGEPTGKGIYTYAKSDVGYTEAVINKKKFETSLPDSQGIKKYANGNVYEIEFENDQHTRKSTYTHESKRKVKDLKCISSVENGLYSGEVDESGNPSGQGIMRYAKGDVYEGGFEWGFPNGQGIMKYTDGDVYKGEFKYGKPTGKGTYTRANLNMKTTPQNTGQTAADIVAAAAAITAAAEAIKATTTASKPSVSSNSESDDLLPKISVSVNIDPKITEALQVIVKRSGKDAFKKGGKANAILADLLPQESYAKYRRRIRNAIDSGVCDFLIDSNLEQEILIKEAVRKLIHHTDMADEIAKETINILIEILI